MSKKLTGLIVTTLALVIFIIGGCGAKNTGTKSTNNQKLTKVTVMLDWTPNTNHTGLYVAKEKGFYKKQGLDVQILQPGNGTTADQVVASGKADFGVSYQEGVTQARAEDIPLVSLAAVIQHNTSGFASLKKDNIKSPKDFEGKRYGGWGSPSEEAMLKAVMKKSGADYSKMKNITLGETDFFNSIGRDADFEWIFYGWDGIEAKRRGIDINYLTVKDLDPSLDYYTPVIVTNEDHINKNSELVKKFMTATAQGYQFSIKNPDAAANILIKAVPEINKDLVKQSQVWLSKKYQDDASKWGVQKEAIWNRYAKWMADRKLISKMIDPQKAFTNKFLP